MSLIPQSPFNNAGGLAALSALQNRATDTHVNAITKGKAPKKKAAKKKAPKVAPPHLTPHAAFLLDGYADEEEPQEEAKYIKSIDELPPHMKAKLDANIKGKPDHVRDRMLSNAVTSFNAVSYTHLTLPTK